jgi:hypothetical protein
MHLERSQRVGLDVALVSGLGGSEGSEGKRVGNSPLASCDTASFLF